MAVSAMGPARRPASKSLPIAEIDILWITAGLGCDGDTIAATAATQPSIEDIVLGALPWIPKVHFHNPFLAPEDGDEFMERFHRAANGKSNPFILVMEGSVPDETNKEEGYWASFGTDRATGQPITTCEWIDRLAPRGVGRDRRRDLRDLRRDSRHGGQSHRVHGIAGLSWLGVAIDRRLSPLFASRVVRSSRITLRKRCCIC